MSDQDNEGFNTFSVCARGKAVIVRTVTFTYVGVVTDFNPGDGSLQTLSLKPAAWVAETGRWGDIDDRDVLAEIDMMRRGVVLNLGTVVDISPWPHAMPTGSR